MQLQRFVKYPAQITEWRVSNFTMQVAMRNHEANLISMAYNCMIASSVDIDSDEFNVAEELIVSGKYILTFLSLSNLRRKQERQTSRKRKDEKDKNKSQKDLQSCDCRAYN